jgi:hypothetical protein
MTTRKVTRISMMAPALLWCLPALAQTGSGDWPPPKVLQIYREEIKPGKAPAHEVVEAGWPKAFAAAKWPTHYLAAASVTGPSEAWFMTGFESFAAWETDTQNIDKNAVLKKEVDQLEAKDGELRSGGRSLVASYREDLSNSFNVDLPKMRYFRIIVFRVKPGHEAQFAEAAGIVKAGYEKAKLTQPWAAYQVYSGMPTPAFLVFIPMKSLAEVDTAFGNTKTIQDAEGEPNVKKLQTISAEAYNAVESNIFAFSPKMSYPSEKWASEDPEFWKPKAAAAMKSEGKKPAAKTEKKSEAH